MSKYMTKIIALFSTNDMSNSYMSKPMSKIDIIDHASIVLTNHMSNSLAFNQYYVKILIPQHVKTHVKVKAYLTDIYVN